MINLQKVAERKESVINLKKEKGIAGQKAQVVLCLDFSGSMDHLYRNGTVQDTLERILPLGLAFDDNGEVDFYIFENGVKRIPENITLNNLDGFINEKVMNKYNMGGTNYAPAINKIVEDFRPMITETVVKKGFFKSTTVETSTPSNGPLDLPVYVIFITDGENSDRSQAERAIQEASKYGIFFQFVGIGNVSFPFLEKLDNLSGRVIDNANFFKIPNLSNCSDDELYRLLMGEFPLWLPLARNAGQIK